MTRLSLNRFAILAAASVLATAAAGSPVIAQTPEPVAASAMARASQPFLTEPPPARLAILPGSSHIDVFGDPVLLAAMILPFLDDATRPPPGGLFDDVPGSE